jgi:hypothetical protein
MEQTQDFRNTIPDWSRYAIWVGGTHDKFYEVRVDLLDSGLWQMTVRFGRRPDLGAGTVKPSVHPSMAIAIALAQAQFDSKVNDPKKGYTIVPRPVDANSQVRLDRRAD